MNPIDQLTANILALGKTLCPDRFPKPNQDVVAEWGRVIAGWDYPVQVWPEAVRYYAESLATDRMATPKDLKTAAKAVIASWDSRPEKRALLRKHRELARDQRDKEIENGTFAEKRGLRATIYYPPVPPKRKFVELLPRRNRA